MTAFNSAYFDDIAIFSATEKHLLHVEHVLNRLIKCNFRINMDKCQCFKEVEFLGHSISRNEVKPIQSKIVDIV